MLAGRVAGTEFTGRIADLAAEPTFGGLRFAYVHAGIVADQRFRYAVTLDGGVAMMLQDGETGGRIEGVAPGFHRLEVWPVAEGTRRLPDFHGHHGGRRAFLRWARSAAPDVRAYNVYRGSELAGTVGQVDVEGRLAAAPDVGAGAGLLTIQGGWTGEPCNRVATVRIVGAGVLEHDLAGGFAEVPFAPGVAVYLPFGVVLVPESPLAAYEPGDEWHVAIGPRTWWPSGELAAGTHAFTVRAVDAAGNESADSEAVTVRVVPLPDDPEVHGVAWDPDAEQAEFDVTIPEGVSQLGVFANYSLLFGHFTDTIVETGPFFVADVSLFTGERATAFVPLPRGGAWRFFVRAIHGDGRQSETAQVWALDTEAVPAGVALSEPEQLSVVATAGGTFRLVWRYQVEGGEDVTEFLVYANEVPWVEGTVPYATVPAALPSGGLAEVTADVGPFGGARWFCVRAGNGAVETRNGAMVAGVPDATAPGAPGTLRGVAN